MVMEGDMTSSGEHVMQYTDDVLVNCTLNIYIISHPMPLNKFNLKKYYKWQHPSPFKWPVLGKALSLIHLPSLPSIELPIPNLFTQHNYLKGNIKSDIFGKNLSQI